MSLSFDEYIDAIQVECEVCGIPAAFDKGKETAHGYFICYECLKSVAIQVVTAIKSES